MTYLSISFVCFTFEKLIICSELLRSIHFNFYSSALWLVNVFLLFFGFVNYIFIYVKVLRRLYICIGLRQRPSSGYLPINVKKLSFKHTCNDYTGIGRRKQQKLVYRIFTCKFSVSSLQCHDLLTLQRRDRKFTYKQKKLKQHHINVNIVCTVYVNISYMAYRGLFA